ncbi:MAG: hypothetical protein IPN67_10615 [Bacteroidales bacterium]|nr:hypothetical protein [Bacteroidales bacterium]
MRKQHFEILFIILAGFSLYISSCTPGSCFDETEARVKATFYSYETGKAITADSVTLYGVNMDTLLIYDKTQKLKIVEFPLFADAQFCRFAIRINGITDTLGINYNSYTHLLSKECGYTFYFDVDTAFHSVNIIDSIAIEKKTITTLNEENMRIYY